jgi:hypothetical protein
VKLFGPYFLILHPAGKKEAGIEQVGNFFMGEKSRKNRETSPNYVPAAGEPW